VGHEPRPHNDRVIAPQRSAWRSRRLAIVVAPILLGATLLVAMTIAASVSRQHQPFGREFCFAEWCVAPTSYQPNATGVDVGLHVRSDAKAALQRPDHPQAWLESQPGQSTGGPQPSLDRQVGPGETYDAVLAFPIPAPRSCPRLVVSEGAWPSFVGLGYAPSPFTERVDWPLCEAS
jgi:hypothetical protein